MVETDRGEDLGLRDEAVRQLDVVVLVGGEDLGPGNLVTHQRLVRGQWGHVPAEDGCNVAGPHLEGSGQVGCFHRHLLTGLCRRKPEVNCSFQYHASEIMSHVARKSGQRVPELTSLFQIMAVRNVPFHLLLYKDTQH